VIFYFIFRHDHTIPAKGSAETRRGSADKLFGMQDALLAIYRKDCTIRLPFLRLSMLNPDAILAGGDLVSDLNGALSSLCEEDSTVCPFSSFISFLMHILFSIASHPRKRAVE